MLNPDNNAFDPAWLRLVPARWRSHLAGRVMLHQMAANAGWLVADKIVRLGVGMVVTIWIARYLGPAEFGVLAFAQTIGILFAALSMLGLPDLIIRDLVKSPADSRTILASAFLLRAGGAVLVVLASLAVVVALRPGEPRIWLIVGLLALGQLAQALDVLDGRYQVINQVRVVILIRNYAFLLFSALKIAAILLKLDVVAIAALIMLELFVVAAGLYLRARYDDKGFRLADARLSEMRRLLQDALPLTLRLAAIALYLRIDQVMISRLLGDAEVGLYTAASRLVELWYFVATAVMTAIVPRLSHLYHYEPARYEAQLTVVVRLLVWASIGFAVLTTIFAPWAIELIYGPLYAGAVPVLMIGAWTAVFSTLGQAVNAWYVNTRLIRYGFYQAVAGAVVSVTLCWLLLPRIGIVGAAVAGVSSQFVAGTLSNLFFRATRPVFWIQLRALTGRGPA